MNKPEDLIPGTKWTHLNMPDLVYTITEVYPSRVIGIDPNGDKFRSSLGGFLMNYVLNYNG